MTIEDLIQEILRRLNYLNTPVDHFLEVDLKEHKKLIDALTIRLDLGDHKSKLEYLANKDLPIIESIRRQNKDLFKNITDIYPSHFKKKYKETEEKRYPYTVNIPNEKPFILNDEGKLKWYKTYEKEIDQYEKIFLQIKKQLTVNKFTLEQCEDFFRLQIVEDWKNDTLFDISDANGKEILYTFLNSPAEIGKNYKSKSLQFNCSNGYAALIFDWFNRRKIFSSTFTRIEKSQIFYSKKGKKINEHDLSGGYGVIKKKGGDYEAILTTIIRKKSSMPIVDANCTPQKVAEYLNFRLSRIFLRNLKR